jgi:hypothetical protein
MLEFIGVVVVIIFIIAFIEGCVEGHKKAMDELNKK